MDKMMVIGLLILGVRALVDLIKYVPAVKAREGLQLAISMALGLAAAALAGIDLIELLLPAAGSQYYTLGVILTGLGVGGGGSLIHDALDVIGKIGTPAGYSK